MNKRVDPNKSVQSGFLVNTDSHNLHLLPLYGTFYIFIKKQIALLNYRTPSISVPTYVRACTCYSIWSRMVGY